VATVALRGMQLHNEVAGMAAVLLYGELKHEEAAD